MSRLILVSLTMVFSGLVLSGCSKKQEITALQRKQAAALASEAEFAITIRDLARAEDLIRQASVLCPDDGSYWMALGNLSKRNGKTTEARKAYEQCVAVYAAAYKEMPTNGNLLMRQMYAEALLGHADKARALIKKAREKHPQDKEIMAFDDATFERMLSNPNFKEMAL